MAKDTIMRDLVKVQGTEGQQKFLVTIKPLPFVNLTSSSRYVEEQNYTDSGLFLALVFSSA